MGKAGRIDTSNRITTESYSSRGFRNYYAPQPQKKKSGSKLRKGEIVFGEILEKKDTHLFKIKLPNGTYTALIENDLKRGDKLYFRILKVDEGLVIRVHSSNLIVENNKLLIDEMVRVLNLSESKVVKNLIASYARRAKRLFRDVIEVAAENMAKLDPPRNSYVVSPEEGIIDLYYSGLDLSDYNTFELLDIYKKPSLIKTNFSELPNENSTLSINRKLAIFNMASDILSSKKVFYYKVQDRFVRLEIQDRNKESIKYLIDDNGRYLVSIDKRNKFLIVESESENINNSFFEENFPQFQIDVKSKSHVFLNGTPEHLEDSHRSMTFVI